MKHNWEYKKLRDVCQKGSSNIQQNKIVGVVGEYPVYGASGYVQNVDFYHQECSYIGIVKDGSGVGRVNRYPAKSSLLGTMQYILPSSAMSLGYLMYCLQALKLSGFASGAAIPHIYFRDYGECLIPVPPLSIQQQIVAELDKVSEIIEKKKQQVKELDNLAQSIFYDMFGNPVENEKGWEVKKFKDSCKRLFAGGDVPKDYFSKESTTEYSVPIFSNGVEREGLYGYTSIPKESEPCITIAGRGTIGYCVIRTKPFFPIIRLIVAVPDENLDVYYFKYLVDALSFKGNGGAIPQLTIPMIKDMAIPIPPLSLQQSFAQKIEAIEKQKELITASIKEAQTLFDARMDYWFGE